MDEPGTRKTYILRTDEKAAGNVREQRAERQHAIGGVQPQAERPAQPCAQHGAEADGDADHAGAGDQRADLDAVRLRAWIPSSRTAPASSGSR